jgi:hypothetical protein
MKNFVRRGSWIDQISPDIRWIYILFLVFVFVGHITFVLMSVYRVGVGYDQIVRHYRGSIPCKGDEEYKIDPLYDRPCESGEGEGEGMAFPKEPIELLEVTHFHAYIEGILLLVLAHLFVAVPLSTGFKRWVMGMAFGSTLMELASPWLIRFVAPQFAFGQMAAWIIMAISYIPLTLAPAYYLFNGPGTTQR